MEGHVTIEQFKTQNERIAHQQRELTSKKIKLQSTLEERNDITEQLQVFKKE